ncbi:MAG: SRPBCC family protein [Hyphomicrobiales bacterium]|nr:SRPBCC family protein [Hyphomicrobiales bacterium]MBV8662621.1 SRPBCC family protein [Hyphomicrobiales bacterium]
MSDRIEKSIELAAPVSRVWRAITDHREFGAWFRVALEGPFVVGETARGHITYPGYEHVVWQAQVQTIEPEKLFAFTWRPYAIDPNKDYSAEQPTLVEFNLQPAETGTRLVISESGFDHVPAARRDEAFRMNDRGWGEQIKNIARYLG